MGAVSARGLHQGADGLAAHEVSPYFERRGLRVEPGRQNFADQPLYPSGLDLGAVDHLASLQA